MRDSPAPWDTDGVSAMPGDVHAELALLGALFCDPQVLPLVDSIVTPETFFEPVLGRMYGEARALVLADRALEPSLICNAMDGDAAFAELGGLRAIADMIDQAPASSSAPDLARLIRELWQRRTLVLIGRELAAAALAPGSKAADLMESLDREVMGLASSAREVVTTSAAEAVDRVVEEFENPAIGGGIKLGLEPFDEYTGGMRPGELWLLAGRPSMGKSALASTGLLNIARHGYSASGRKQAVLEISLEMDVGGMMRRHIVDAAFEAFSQSTPNYSEIRKRQLTDQKKAAFYHGAQLVRGLEGLRLLYKPGLTLSGLRSIVRRERQAFARKGMDLALVVLDHVGLVGMDPGSRARSRYESQTETAIGAKELAGDLGIPILALAQLSRATERRDDPHPTLDDLRDSGAWEENASGAIGVFREAYYAQRKPEPKKYEDKVLWEEQKRSPWLEAIFMKVREGSIGTARLWCDMGRNAIRGEQPDASFAFFDSSLPAQAPPRQRPADLLDPDTALAPRAETIRPPGGNGAAASYDPSEFE